MDGSRQAAGNLPKVGNLREDSGRAKRNPFREGSLLLAASCIRHSPFVIRHWLSSPHRALLFLRRRAVLEEHLDVSDADAVAIGEDMALDRAAADVGARRVEEVVEDVAGVSGRIFARSPKRPGEQDERDPAASPIKKFRVARQGDVLVPSPNHGGRRFDGGDGPGGNLLEYSRRSASRSCRTLAFSRSASACLCCSLASEWASWTRLRCGRTKTAKA